MMNVVLTCLFITIVVVVVIIILYWPHDPSNKKVIKVL